METSLGSAPAHVASLPLQIDSHDLLPTPSEPCLFCTRPCTRIIREASPEQGLFAEGHEIRNPDGGEQCKWHLGTGRECVCRGRESQQAPRVTSQIQGGRGRGGKRGEGTRRSIGSLPEECCCMEYEPTSKQEKLRYEERVNCLSAKVKQEQINKTSHMGLLASFSSLCSLDPKQSACHLKLNILPGKSCSCRA